MLNKTTHHCIVMQIVSEKRSSVGRKSSNKCSGTWFGNVYNSSI